MEFIKIAFMITTPLFILWIWFGNQSYKKIAFNLLAVSNFLLIGNSVFLAWQLYGAFKIAKMLSIDIWQSMGMIDGFMVRVGFLIILPLLTYYRNIRKSPFFSLVMLLLLYWTFPVNSWNGFDLLFKIPGYLCLFCAVFALTWLLKKLPYQTTVD